MTLPAVVSPCLDSVFAFSFSGHFFQLQQHQSVQSDQENVRAKSHQDKVQPHTVNLKNKEVKYDNY